MLSVPVLRGAQALATYLPRPVAAPLATIASRGYAQFSPQERRVVARNLRRILGPDVDESVIRRDTERVFESYGRYWLDSLRLPHLSPAQIDAGFTHEGLHTIAESMEAGIAPVIAMPHLGGWEWAATWFTQVAGWPVTSVAERLEPPELFEWFLEYRARLGMHIVALGPSAAAEVAARLAGGSVVSLLCDRDISGDGIVVEFFGEPTRLPGGPAVTALRSGAPLIPAAAYFQGRMCHGVALEPIDTERRGKLRADVTRVTQDLAYALETLICRAPEQWHLLQPNWPSDYDALGMPRPAWLVDL